MNKAHMIPTMFYRQSNVLLFTLFIYSSNFVYKNNLPLFAGHICVPLLIVFDLPQINPTSRKRLSYQDVRSLLRKTFWKWCLLLTNHDGRSLQNHINHIVKDQRGPERQKAEHKMCYLSFVAEGNKPWN